MYTDLNVTRYRYIFLEFTIKNDMKSVRNERTGCHPLKTHSILDVRKSRINEEMSVQNGF